MEERGKALVIGESYERPWMEVQGYGLAQLSISTLSTVMEICNNLQNCFFVSPHKINRDILCCEYLFLGETQTLDDSSSSGSTASVFKHKHEAKGQSSQQRNYNNSRFPNYFFDRKLLESIWYVHVSSRQ